MKKRSGEMWIAEVDALLEKVGMDNFLIRLELMQVFAAIFKDACERQDWTYLKKFMDSELAMPALETWRLVDRESYDAFGYLIKSVNKHAQLEERDEYKRQINRR